MGSHKCRQFGRPDMSGSAARAGRIIGDAVSAAMAEYDRIEAKRTPAERAARQAATDREIWLPLIGVPCDDRREGGLDVCARCGEERPHTRRQGLCKSCMRYMRRFAKSAAARPAGAAP